MLKYAGFIKNDTVNGDGFCVSFFTQGCPHHCKGCFNPETWDPAGGKVFDASVMNAILEAISDNGITRNLSILGGEPLAPYNLKLVTDLIVNVKRNYPSIKIFIWTGYEINDVLLEGRINEHLKLILEETDYLITGPFIEEKKDLTLKWRGSSNQEIWHHCEHSWMKES